ncbi:MAG: hypothetical protein KBD50_03720 [Candidatus Pacebacteria bacterium]|nr:hypothetical protein [Candidatus Paceibacterota bacterium]
MAKRKKKATTPVKKAPEALTWYFPTTDHGENDGFADSQLEYFQGDHEHFIAREAIQNAVDARLYYEKPVTVVFEKLSIPTSTLPGHAELASRLNRCLAFVKGQDKAEVFFKSAIALLKGKDLPILKISDFNTKGLSGSDDDVNGNWYRLVKAAGTSSPKGVKGGSFGIGKGAPIAASALRTVFYSSINDKNELVFQGKARLVSHHDDKKDVRRGIGFYGVQGYNAVRKSSLVPEMFRREGRGTDIFVLGYKSGGNWEHKLIRSVLDNFWLAIHHGTLEVIVRDGEDILITKDTLRKCLEDYDAEETRYFYEAVTDASSTFEEELKHLGKVTLWVRKNDNYPSRIMMARKPKMVVQEKRSRALREPYAGVMICDNDRGNELLRDLEPPTHDKWDKDRASNGPVALRELDIFINKSLKSMGDSLTSEPQDIPGLDRYLPDSEDRDYMPSNPGEAMQETGFSSSEESGREVGANKDAENGEIESIMRKSVVTSKQQGPVTPTPPQGPGKGPHGRDTGPAGTGKDGARINTSSVSFRSFVQNGKGGLEYHLVITGREDCEGAIRLVAVGDDGSYPLELKSATDATSGKSYDIGESLIKGLVIENGKAVKIAVRLSSGKKYTLGIENYEG